jgi:hypothetical protein
MPPNTVKVDRSTPWGNPFIVGKHGTRARCVELYARLMGGYLCLLYNCAEQKTARDYVAKHRRELAGKNLACRCRDIARKFRFPFWICRSGWVDQ